MNGDIRPFPRGPDRLVGSVTPPRRPRSGRTSMTADDTRPDLPGDPSAGRPTVEEPVEPRPPLPPKPDQAAPTPVSATGRGPRTDGPPRAQAGAYLTHAQGTRLPDSDHSLKAGPRGPVLLQDHHLREKITHFDHERIPERVVHARGAGAHGG